jgi:tripeptide aminopeptidase
MRAPGSKHSFSFHPVVLSALLTASAINPSGALAGGLHAHHGGGTAPAGSDESEKIESMIAAPLPKEVKPAVSTTVRQLAASAPIKTALAFLQSDESRFVNESIQISEIPAPTFVPSKDPSSKDPVNYELKRAEAFRDMLKANGLTDVRLDSINNVIGVRKGLGNGPKIAIIAHLDTVFPIETVVKVRREGSILYGPGLTDDSNALAMMLSWIRALQAASIQTNADLIFVGSVGEEGNGDLRGVKQFFQDHPNINAAVILEGAVPPEAIGIQNTGSYRYKIVYTGPGGHSYEAFGKVPSAIHAQGRFIAKVADLQVPAKPRTTFTVGIVRGGTSVNTIAPKAELEIDMRSNGKAELDATRAKIQTFAEEAVVEENKRWGTTTAPLSLTKTITEIGNRPVGMTSPEHSMVHTWMAAAQAQGIQPKALVGASTDAGVPISLGIPTIVMGCGGKTGGFHSVTEHWDPTDTYKGVQLSFLTTMALAGVQGVSQPTLPLP